MNQNTQKKVAIVTGASRGIGAAVAKRLARDGFTVVVNYAGSAKAAEAVVREIEAAGGSATSAQADVSRSADVRRLFDTVQEVYGGVDVLVNNAGVMALANVADLTDEDFDRLFAINVKGSYNTMREAGGLSWPCQWCHGATGIGWHPLIRESEGFVVRHPVGL